MLVKLFARNYNTLDGLVNGASGSIQRFHTIFFKIIYMDTIL
jgi:hypothetical protein